MKSPIEFLRGIVGRPSVPPVESDADAMKRRLDSLKANPLAPASPEAVAPSTPEPAPAQEAPKAA